MNFLISLFKKAKKGDSYRTPESPDKYNDKISQLNATGDNQYAKLKDIVTTQKNTAAADSRGTTIPK